MESVRDVRAHSAEVVERADRDDVPTVITRRGEQVAAVVSIIDNGEPTVRVVHVGHRSTVHDT